MAHFSIQAELQDSPDAVATAGSDSFMHVAGAWRQEAFMIAPSSTRVIENTDDEINQRIRRRTEMSIAYFRDHPNEIDQRLEELNREWDIERVLGTGSSALTLTGLVLAIGVSRKWLLLSLAVQGFFMQHALQGWCPPLPLFRRLGVRTADEINEERNALHAIRGEVHTVR